MLPIRWFLALLAVFLAVAGLDLWFSQTGARPSSATGEERLDGAAFLAAANAGELREGHIVYRANSTGLADLHAQRKGAAGAGATHVRATARLTDAEVTALRTQHFAEDDPVSYAAARAVSARERTASIVHAIVHPLGLITLIVGILFVVQRYAGRFTAFSAQRLRPVTSGVSFSSVAGCDEAKDEVYEVVEFLRDPARFRQTGGRMPKGVLLVGPPGTGKTMLAKAVAGEARANFYSLSGSDFVELYVGVGASRVRSLFKKARETAPSIIFIDEIDAIGRQRSAAESGGAQQEHDQTLNALLVAMDGFDSDDAVVVFGATNRPDTMDRALLRPGRFDRQVSVGLPDLRGRLAILQVHAGSVKLDPSVDLQEIAKATPGFSGADLANLLNEGAIHAARHRRATILHSDLDEARDKINWGRETRRVMTVQDKAVIAYHEAGHALMQVLSGEDVVRVQKVTIIPRGRSLGSTHFTPERDLFNYSQPQLIAKLRCLMAGRVAEEIALGSITSGASGDIQEATKTARQMVLEWGMSPLGFMALSRPDGDEPLASPQTFHEAERHVRALLDENYAATTRALTTHRAALDAIADELIRCETILGNDVRRIAAQHPPSALAG
ncbi:ATP-dependent zinc metalloprotease FtsH [Opitutus terrae]|uniref:ATP-dependent zinc metalloprotease FtsH n=1 Tax=Opitutus terrae (strain DSM 11246 / JCM 15787 / PB90-1) TaxID=452637 RepID=FTSH_OPITP|nr:ATP-dependent zinc metalloprotease FtsH [Opitutus terrae]B1ZMG6.1 RecName: Full=ATP-dependent zinc metalloprotease FtsH [Opitutus terrae PB90-1]ACB73419.1 ATP-dependent metalloprotease FtsH [Opitutus terrae PB90-1]